MEGSKNSTKRKLTAINTSKIRKIPNKQPALYVKEVRKQRTNQKLAERKKQWELELNYMKQKLGKVLYKIFLYGLIYLLIY